MKRIDFVAVDNGATWAFTPVSDAARLWLRHETQASQLVVDHRLAEPLMGRMFDAGLQVDFKKPTGV